MFFLLTVPGRDPNGREEQERQIHQALLKLAAGERDAIAEIYQFSRTRVYALALSILGNPQDAEDILHDTFIQIYRMAHRYNGSGRPMPWILTIAQNLARMKLRRKSSTELPLEDWNSFRSDDPTLTAEDRVVLDAAMSCLDAAERQIVMLHAVAGFKHREIAQLMEISLPAAVSKYHRAIQKLGKKLQEEAR